MQIDLPLLTTKKPEFEAKLIHFVRKFGVCVCVSTAIAVNADRANLISLNNIQ